MKFIVREIERYPEKNPTQIQFRSSLNPHVGPNDREANSGLQRWDRAPNSFRHGTSLFVVTTSVV